MGLLGVGQMILCHSHRPRQALAYSGRASFSINGGKALMSPLSSTVNVCRFNLSSNSLLRCSSNDKGSFNHHEGSGQEEFTVLGADIPWDAGTMWRTFAFYLFTLHIPLSFGALAILSNLFHQDPQAQAISLVGIQMFELAATLFLVKSTANPEFKLLSIFEADKSPKQRNPWLASALGFGFLVVLVFLTSFAADIFLGPNSKSTRDPVLQKILRSSSNLSTIASGIACCVIIPLLEEIIYRWILLRSLLSSMKWQKAVLLSSAIFSAIHFSGENFLQLFLAGCVLGCTYCWSGDLKASILVHSLYNAMILAITYVS